MENLLDKITQHWVKITGNLIDPENHQWLVGPTGDTDVIGNKFINQLAEEGNLNICTDQNNYGLLEDIGEFGLSDNQIKLLRPEIVDFYVNTSSYNFEVWSEWTGIFKPFGWLLSVLFSKRLQQLNLPLNPLDASKGLSSQIIKLKKEGSTIWTVWYRKLKSNHRVIYSGVYTTCKPDHYSKPLLKVIFPLPNGNASVIMTIKVEQDGSLLLSSDGNKFGDNGFYFTLTNKKGKFWAKFVKVMHEWIRVYVDKDGILRTDHNLNIYGLRFLKLHYKMIKHGLPKY